MDQAYRDLLIKQQYRLYKDHSAVKLCHWMKESMIRDRHCYKQDFYGVQSHRCLQMTPALNECDHRCTFCWRVQEHDFAVDEWAEPKEMLDNLIEQQRKLISGFKGDPRCDLERFKEAQNPNQVAISLAGEPITYPYLSDLLKECHSRGMTTFLVTNGTYPERLEALDELPMMLYVTVAAPNESVYRQVCRPKVSDGWNRLMRTLDLLPSLDTRTIIRHTLVKGANMGWLDEYAALDRRADTDLVEPKGYVFVGGSRTRLSMDCMPSFAEIKDFSRQLGDRIGKSIINEREDSRVVLLGTPGMVTDVREYRPMRDRGPPEGPCVSDVSCAEQVRDDRDVQHQEQVDQFELRLVRLVVGQPHSEDPAPRSEERCDDERPLGGAPLVGPGLVLVPHVHAEHDQVDDRIGSEDDSVGYVHRIRSGR